MFITFENVNQSHISAIADGALFLSGDAFGPAITNNAAVCDGALVVHGDAEGEQSSEIEIAHPSLIEGQLFVAGEASGYVRLSGVADGILPLAGEAYAASANTYSGFTEGGFRLEGEALELAPLSAYGFLVDRPPLMEGYGGLVWEDLRDGFDATDSHYAGVIAVINNALASLGAATSRAVAASTLAEGMKFSDALSVVHMMLVKEGITFDGGLQFTYSAVARAIDRLLLGRQTDSYADAVAIIASGLVFGQLLEALDFEGVESGVVTNAVIADAFAAINTLLDTMLATEAATDTFTALMVVEDSLVATAALGSEAALHSLARDAVGLRINLSLDNDDYVAWVLNAESKGLTRYTNYPFNSYFQLGGVHYGLTDTGLYSLSGDTDDGVPIAAKLRMGMSDLGTRVLKQVPEVYIGYSSTGAMLLRSITPHPRTGERQSALYRLKPRGAATSRESRFEGGRGVESVDWDFELENIDGADFELDSIQFSPMRTTRRTRS